MQMDIKAWEHALCKRPMAKSKGHRRKYRRDTKAKVAPYLQQMIVNELNMLRWRKETREAQ